MTQHPQARIVLAFIAVYLIWGSTYLAIRMGVETLPPFLMIGIRFIIGGLLLCGWTWTRGAARPRRSHWLTAVITGLLLPAGGTGLVAWGAQTVPSGLTALLVATAPIWILLVDWLRRGGTRPSPAAMLGLLLGFGGVVLLINPTAFGGAAKLDMLGAGAILVATLSWAIGSIYTRHAAQPDSKLLATGMQMLTGGAALLIGSVLTGELRLFDPAAVSPRSWLALSYLIVAGTVAFAAYVWLLSATTPARAATYAYVNPVVALALGCLVAGEQLTNRTLICAAIIVGAVMLTLKARKPAPQPAGGAGAFVRCEATGCRKA